VPWGEGPTNGSQAAAGSVLDGGLPYPDMNDTRGRGMVRPVRPASALCAAALVLTLIGCGSGLAHQVTPPAASPTSPTGPAGPAGRSAPAPGGAAPASANSAARSRYIDLASAVCDRYTPLFAAVPTPGEGADSAAEATFLDTLRDLNQRQLTELRALPRPPADGAVLSSLYTDNQTMIDETAEGVARLRAGQTSAAQRLLSDVDARADAVNRRFDVFGLRACGSAQTLGDVATA